MGERPAPLGLLSLNTVDMYRPIDLVSNSLGLYLNTVRPIKTTPPKGITSTRRGLTTNVNACNEAAMLNHTPTRFKFLFLAVCRSDLNAKPHRESVTAHSEQDARRSLAGQFVLSFAGRVPAQGACNA
ncbi:host cell division inhibitor Icd-like protein [Yersinia massiliensis]|uniref:host cell division inhibitor Icd-like protein n=1 Tax=Yersinia massiliensis TaxID=419257 RepID=UPI0028F3F606|nr:host cell division inhibitor Icd-like protein [Yersinia massiliensis]